jgi:hypothetical protein
MAQEIDDTGKNAMLDQLATLVTRVALHTGDPGAANTAANEVTGGSPAYARQAITWNAAASANLDSSNAPVFDVPAGTTVTWVSFWNTAGTVRYGKKQVTSEAFGAQGTYTLTDADIALSLNP